MKLSKKIVASLLASAMTVSMTAAATSAFADEAETTTGASEVKTGDVNGDGDVGMLDVTETQKFIADLVELTPAQRTAADVDAPYGEINLVDVVTVQKYIAELISTFPVDAQSDDSDSEKDTEAASDTEESTDSAADTASDAASDSEEDSDGVLNLKEAREKGTGATITLRGQVVYIYGSNTVILEEVIDGEVVSYQIYDYNGVKDGKYPINAIVEVSGTTSEYNSVLQISKPTDVKTVSEDNEAIAPVESTVKDLENHISTMVIIKDATYTAGNDNNATITDVTGSVNLFKPAELPEDYTEGAKMDLICCPYIYQGETQIRNSSTADYIILEADTESDTETTSSDTDEDKAAALENLNVYIYYIELYGNNANDDGIYTDESFATLIALYNEAKTAIENNGENYTVEQLEKLAEDLGVAWSNLEYSPYGNLSGLVSAIKKYGDDTNDKGYYTAESYAEFDVLYQKAVAYVADTTTLSDEEAGKLYDDLYDFWNDGLELTSVGLINEIINVVQHYGDDSNEGGYYTEESYSTFIALYNEALEFMNDPSTYTNEQIDKLADDLAEAYNNLKYTRKTLLTLVDNYVQNFASDYDEVKAAGITEWVAAYDLLKAIQTNPDNYDDDAIYTAIETFYDLCDSIGLLGY